MSGVFDTLRRRNHALPTVVSLGGTLVTMLTISVSPIAGLFIGVFFVFATYMELLTQLSFRAPSSRKPKLLDEQWNPKSYVVNGIEMFTNHALGERGKPTLWICHGWTSGSERMVGRARSFRAKGWNVVMVDLPSHGGSGRLKKWTAEESCTLAMGAMNLLAADLPQDFIGPVYFYGHSMGAFIGLRVSQRRQEFVFGDRLAGWVFESPMTGYTEIFDETCRLLKVPRPFRPLLMRKTIRHFNAINNRPTKFTRLAEADMPLWGMPREPVLLVQAEPDERLGAAHHKRLTRAFKEAGLTNMLTAHHLESLRHSGSAVHEERDGLVSEWIETHSSSL